MPGTEIITFGLLLKLAAVLSDTNNCHCPPDYVATNGKCYYFSSSNVSSWQEAVSKCKAIEAQLLSIETEEENFMIEAYVTKKGREITYWTSGSDEENHGQWKWTSTGEDFTFKGWLSGEPSPGEEHCVQIAYVGGHIGWNNAPCNQEVHWGNLPYHYICERSTISAKELSISCCQDETKEKIYTDTIQNLASLLPCSNTLTKTKTCKHCPVNFVQLEGRCYHFSDTVSNWEKAYSHCKKLNSNLVSIESYSEAFALNEYLVRQTRMVNYWTSGSDAQVEGQWQWTTIKQPFTYTQWCGNQPDNANNKEHHLHLFHKSGVVCWNDLPGNTESIWGATMGYICESPLS